MSIFLKPMKLSACSLAAVSFTTDLMAQTSVKPWDVTCDATTARCTTQAAVVTDSGERIAILGVQINKDGSDAVLFVATQLGVALRPGVRVTGDQFETSLPFDICLKDGCRASVTLDQANLVKILSIAKLDLQVFPFGADAAVSIAFPIDGLGVALGAQVTLPKP